MEKVVIQHENAKCVYKKIGKIFFRLFLSSFSFYSREAARECRRKKKEYIKCLEERVAGLENQNKALIEELRQLKELYCQREETNKKK
jgi:chaperonin cofactor prefoldin